MRALFALARWLLRHECATCHRWIARDDHRGEHALCYHLRRIVVHERARAQWSPLVAPSWLNPCPDCGARL